MTIEDLAGCLARGPTHARAWHVAARPTRFAAMLAASAPSPAVMRCHVYKSLRRADTYLYLAARDDFAPLPDALRDGLGELQWVMALELAPGRRLAREDADVVRANLARCGFHLQMPPQSTLAALDRIRARGRD